MSKEIYVVSMVNISDQLRKDGDEHIYVMTTERSLHLSSTLEKAESWLFHNCVNASLDPADYKDLICVIHDTVGTYRNYYVENLEDRNFYYRIAKMYLDDELE